MGFFTKALHPDILGCIIYVMKQKYIKLLGFVSAAGCGMLSVGGLATVTMQWVGADSAESYYGEQLHSAAQAHTNPTIWVVLVLLLCISTLLFWFIFRKFRERMTR